MSKRSWTTVAAVACAVLGGLAVRSAPVHAATFKVNSSDNTDDGRCNAAHCSLKEAILQANKDAAPDLIVFDLPVNRTRTCGKGGFCYELVSTSAIEAGTLPAITGPVSIDATLQPGYAGAPFVELHGGLLLEGGSDGSVIRGLSICSGTGIEIRSSNNVVAGNYIGIDRNGNPRPNGTGVLLEVSASSNLIGGEASVDRNVISGNSLDGVAILGKRNRVQGNYIGTNVGGTRAVGNGDNGVLVFANGGFSERFGTFVSGAPDNLIGGARAGQRNVISGNHGAGVAVKAGSLRTKIGGNFIGIDAAGTRAVPNGEAGVLVVESSSTVVGLASEIQSCPQLSPDAICLVVVARGNVISGNMTDGVRIVATELTPGQTVVGNFIGTTADGVGQLGNGGSGVLMTGGFPDDRHTIGETTASAANVIAYNGGAGVALRTTDAGESVRGNRIFSNRGLGIDRFCCSGPDGITPNASLLFGHESHFPVLDSATVRGSTITIAGGFTGYAGDYAIDLYASSSCDQAGHGEGERYVGTVVDHLDRGTETRHDFIGTFTASVAAGEFVTATATRTGRATSEFSACFPVNAATVNP